MGCPWQRAARCWVGWGGSLQKMGRRERRGYLWRTLREKCCRRSPNGGIDVSNPIWDTSVAAHMLGKPSTVLSQLALSEFGQELPTLGLMCCLGRGAKAIPFHALDGETAMRYACSAADYVLRMKESMGANPQGTGN